MEIKVVIGDQEFAAEAADEQDALDVLDNVTCLLRHHGVEKGLALSQERIEAHHAGIAAEVKAGKVAEAEAAVARAKAG